MKKSRLSVCKTKQYIKKLVSHYLSEEATRLNCDGKIGKGKDRPPPQLEKRESIEDGRFQKKGFRRVLGYQGGI